MDLKRPSSPFQQACDFGEQKPEEEERPSASLNPDKQASQECLCTWGWAAGTIECWVGLEAVSSLTSSALSVPLQPGLDFQAQNSRSSSQTEMTQILFSTGMQLCLDKAFHSLIGAWGDELACVPRHTASVAHQPTRCPLS